MDRLTPEKRREVSRLGGLARARALSPQRRREIAKLGFQAMVDRRFGGDRAAAIRWLTDKGLWAQDPCPWNGVFRDPGPMPPPPPPPPPPEDLDQVEEPEEELPF